jgi:K+-transporting ATPase ATPase C chain
MRRQLVTALFMTVVLAVLLGGAYPLAVYAAGQLAFPHRAGGSLVTGSRGTVAGSSLVGQLFTDAAGNPLPQYFQARPSAAGDGYDPRASGASNLGPTSPALVGADGLVAKRAAAYRSFNGLRSDVAVPVDAVTASGSGLDPDISPANAQLQAPRVAAARGMPVATVLALVDRHTEGRQWGFLGEKVVNVLELNLDLDRQV